LDDPFINLDRVGDLKEGDGLGSNTPIEIIQNKPIQIPQTGEGQRRCRFKTFAGRTDLPFVCKLISIRSVSSSSPSQPPATTPKISTKPSTNKLRNPAVTPANLLNLLALQNRSLNRLRRLFPLLLAQQLRPKRKSLTNRVPNRSLSRL